MIKNYIKIAFKTLLRNKLYTVVSLFGIAFTLGFLMLSFAVFENELGQNRPLSNKDRILFLTELRGEMYEQITETKYDTSKVNGVTVIDSVVTVQLNEAVRSGMGAGGFSKRFKEEFLNDLENVQALSISTGGKAIDLVFNDNYFNWIGIYTDHDYWKVFDFKFIEGAPFSQSSIENQSREIILTESAASKYFGKQKSYVGREVDWGYNGKFKVTGVVENSSSTISNVRSDCFLPLSWETNSYGHDFFSVMQIAILVKEAQDVNTLKNHLKRIETVMAGKGDYHKYWISAKSSRDIYEDNILGKGEEKAESKVGQYFTGALVLFLLIPLLNLINLNNSRVSERSSEIGVRKAFGATSNHILNQFLFENLIITILGGILAFLLSWIGLKILNDSEFFDGAKLRFNLSLYLIYMVITAVFSVFSGLIPAFKISKTKIVNALKTSKL